MLTAGDLIYDAATHTTVTPDGIDVPHVTHILSAVGVSTDFEALAASSRRLDAAITHRSLLGTALHRDAHAFDDGDLDEATVHPEVAPYLDAWATCRLQTGLAPLTRERQVFHRTCGYTGFLDGIFAVPRGRKTIRVLADLKTGGAVNEVAGALQTAAYQAAYELEHPAAKDRIDERWIIWLRPGRTIPYDIINCSARRTAFLDFQKFRACLTVFHLQPNRVPRDW